MISLPLASGGSCVSHAKHYKPSQTCSRKIKPLNNDGNGTLGRPCNVGRLYDCSSTEMCKDNRCVCLLDTKYDPRKKACISLTADAHSGNSTKAPKSAGTGGMAGEAGGCTVLALPV